MVLFIFYNLLLYCVCVCVLFFPVEKWNCFSVRLTVVSFPLYESKCLIETN